MVENLQITVQEIKKSGDQEFRNPEINAETWMKSKHLLDPELIQSFFSVPPPPASLWRDRRTFTVGGFASLPSLR